ncbi:MAG: tetratricopeptide repeat protein [Halofilum sp. (in: g-proteobacteria)]|nr:tetratricopeptide repeat protein [Halofilum sp. (in: g-proteobacteria)]
MTTTNSPGAGSAVCAPRPAAPDHGPDAGPSPRSATPRRRRPRLRAAVLALAALLALAPAAWAQVDVDRLAELVEAGEYEAAYELAHEHVGDMAGNVRFDFYYGIAAVDSGHLGEGVFALERVLIAQPGADRARLELARAYFLRGDDRRARREFEAVEAHDPPAPVQAQIERYQLAMQKRAGRYETTVTGYLESGIGFTSRTSTAAPADAESVDILGGWRESGLGERQPGEVGLLRPARGPGARELPGQSRAST